METKREWTSIKEYEDILFDYYNGIAVLRSIANVTGMLSPLLQQAK